MGDWTHSFHDRLTAIERHIFGDAAATQIAESTPDFTGDTEALTTADTPEKLAELAGTAPVGAVVGPADANFNPTTATATVPIVSTWTQSTGIGTPPVSEAGEAAANDADTAEPASPTEQ